MVIHKCNSIYLYIVESLYKNLYSMCVKSILKALYYIHTTLYCATRNENVSSKLSLNY